MLTPIKIIGVYKIIPTTESIIQAIKFQKYDWLLDGNGIFTDTIYRENFENLSLIEIQVLSDFTPAFLQTISQRHLDDSHSSRQAPYLEYYLDSSGENLLSEDEAIYTDNRRVCFFLHFADTDLPLSVGETLLKLPSTSELPERLIDFTHYVPSD